jgi:hypothetical protein
VNPVSHRPNSLLLLSVMGLLILFGVPQSGKAADDRLMLFHELAKVIENAGEAMAKIANGFRRLSFYNTAEYNPSAAERNLEQLKAIRNEETKRLIILSGQAQDLVARQMAAIVGVIDEYLTWENPTPDMWKQVQKNVDSVLAQVGHLLEDVRNEKSEFVLEPSYLELSKSLHARGVVLGRLSQLPMPSSPEEKTALYEINQKYKVLIVNTQAAIEEMNAYLKAHR